MRKNRVMSKPRCAAAFLFLLSVTVVAQLLIPSSASTELYFAQLADGGPASQKWAVTLILDNPNSTVSSVVTVNFYNGSGQALPIDFGSGPSAVLKVTLPPGGSTTFTSLGASSTTNTGYAIATANNPVTGTVLYRATNNGTPVWDVAAAGTGPTYLYNSFANYNLGIALVNPSATQTINLLVTAQDSGGGIAGTIPVSLTPNAHTSFDLGISLNGFPTDFTGSISITSTDNPPTQFVAWALNSRSGLLSPLPPGELRFPSSYQRRANDVFAQMISAQNTLVAAAGGMITNPAAYAQLSTALKLSIDPGSTIDASAPGDGKVHVTTAMLEALGDSRSGLGFLLAYLTVFAVGGNSGDSNPAETADILAIFSVLQAGYDPSGPADLFARLQFAKAQNIPVTASILNDFSGAADSRLQEIWSEVQQSCTGAQLFGQICQASHNLWHQDYPSSQIP